MRLAALLALARPPRDPTRPGVFMLVMETQEATLIAVWENVPRAR
jgi:hypothetical protein